MPDEQSQVIDFLTDPATHGGAEVERIDTHCAHVFLAGDTAWKIKRAVRYDYLDFSTLEKRKAILERELALNSPSAPSLYRRVVAVTREPDGALAIGGAGIPVEYALEMRRFPAGAQLDRVADAGGLTDALAADLGRVVADYHARAEIRPANGADLIREIIEELEQVFERITETLGAAPVTAFSDKARQSFARLAPLLAERTARGHVRRCHSDLHLANLVLLDGRPVPFDALEFDERLGTCDTFYDIAFLVMDLLHRGHRRQANLCLNGYLEGTLDDAALAALPLFLSIRAAIRAMVDVQTAAATGAADLVPAAQHYLAEAVAFLDPPPPRLVCIGGYSGTGKTTVARAVAPDLGAPPGALHLRSDVERKSLLHVGPLDRLPDSAYSAEVTLQVHDRLFGRAAAALAAGHAVLLDATFLDPGNRRRAKDLANEQRVPFHGVWLAAPAEVLLERVGARARDASDATPDVVRAQLARGTGALDWVEIDAAAPHDSVVARIRDHLFPD